MGGNNRACRGAVLVLPAITLAMNNRFFDTAEPEAEANPEHEEQETNQGNTLPDAGPVHFEAAKSGQALGSK